MLQKLKKISQLFSKKITTTATHTIKKHMRYTLFREAKKELIKTEPYRT